MLSVNSGNYVLTKDGVISKLDSYWDRLQEITHRLDGLSKLMQKKLINSFVGTFLFVIVVFWIEPVFQISLILLALISLGAFSLAAIQLMSFFEFMDLKKKGMVLYQELYHEVEWNAEQEYLEEISLEERILLNNFLLSAEMPISPYLYGSLLALLPLSVLGIFTSYFFYF
jgi:hypothetical protein